MEGCAWSIPHRRGRVYNPCVRPEPAANPSEKLRGNPSVRSQICRSLGLVVISISAVSAAVHASPAPAVPAPMTISGDWQLQDVAKVPQAGAEVSRAAFNTRGLVCGHGSRHGAHHAGEQPRLSRAALRRKQPARKHSREPGAHLVLVSHARSTCPRRTRASASGSTSTASTTPSTVWVNGVQVGTTRGAFIRGIFDITANVKPGKKAVLAVLVAPQPHPGISHEHTLRNGIGTERRRDRHRRAYVSLHHRLGLDSRHPRPRHRHLAEGLSLRHRPGGGEGSARHHRPSPAATDSADVAVQATVENVSEQTGDRACSQGSIEEHCLRAAGRSSPRTASKIVSFDPKTTPALHLDHPRLWWPNGYGAAESLPAASELQGRQDRFPTRRTSASASARSPTACPAPTRSPSPSTACRSSSAAATGAWMKP